MEYHMLYVEGRKNFKLRREKKTYLFAECKKKTLGKLISLPSAEKTLGKLISLPSATNGHSANS